MTRAIYTDNGVNYGRRTRLFRVADGGFIEWMFAVDYTQGDDRWFFFAPHKNLQSMLDAGYNLTLWSARKGGGGRMNIAEERESAMLPLDIETMRHGRLRALDEVERLRGIFRINMLRVTDATHEDIDVLLGIER